MVRELKIELLSNGNVLRLQSVWAIPPYRVYRLYDSLRVHMHVHPIVRNITLLSCLLMLISNGVAHTEVTTLSMLVVILSMSVSVSVSKSVSVTSCVQLFIILVCLQLHHPTSRSNGSPL